LTLKIILHVNYKIVNFTQYTKSLSTLISTCLHDTELLGNVQISYDAYRERVCSDHQSTIIWEEGVWPNRPIIFIVAKKA